MIWSVLFLASSVVAAATQPKVFELSMRDAERQAVSASNSLKASLSDHEAAEAQTSAQFEGLLPRLSLQGTYQYYAEIPQIHLGGGPAIPFGTNSTYSAGPALSYTLWDTFSGRKSYHAASFLAEARNEDRKNSELQTLFALRSAYVQVQLGLEELLLIQGSLELARAQDRDVATRFHAGAAARLDVVTSQRTVLSYEIQFKQRQAELSAALKDLFTLLGDHQPRDLSRPGPVGVPGVSLAFRLEPLEQLLTEENETGLRSPDDEQPQIKSQLLQSRSLDASASGQTAKLFPTVQLSAGVNYNRPDVPNPPSFWQETVGLSLSMPLFLGDPTRHFAAQNRSQADAADYRAAQLRDNLGRDYAKAQEMLTSLREQARLAAEDVRQSVEEARLYFVSYKAGKLNFIDVQNANNQSLVAKVNAARIDAQTLNQIITLKAISGKESQHD